MKKSLLIGLLVLSNCFLFATPAYITSYRNATYYFENNDYGKALTYAEDAILLKKEQSENEIAIIKKSLSSRALKSSGDNLYNIVKVLESRNEVETVDLIKHYQKLKGEDFFNNSMSNLLSYISDESSYPEAQFLIGNIYKTEGEYPVAESYYLMALDNKNVLDIPDFKFEILYSLAEISQLQGDENKYEARLLNILVDDKSSSDQALHNAISYTIKSNKTDSMEKFFTLYRAYDFNSIKAYMNLSDYYEEKGYIEKALKYSALAVITGFTKIYDVLDSRNNEFEYTNFSSYLEEVNNCQDIVDWGIEEDYWRSFNSLANLCTESGYNNFAEALLKVLVKQSPQEYWQKEAVLQLSNY